MADYLLLVPEMRLQEQWGCKISQKKKIHASHWQVKSLIQLEWNFIEQLNRNVFLFGLLHAFLSKILIRFCKKKCDVLGKFWLQS